MTLRGGYGLSHAPISGFTQLPQPDFGATSGLRLHRAFRHGEPELRHAPGRESAGASADLPQPGDLRPPARRLTACHSQQPLLPARFGGFAVSQNYHTPYVNNWNLTISWQANNTTTVEFAYSGNMGIHLFMPQEDINPKNSSLLSAQNRRQHQHHGHDQRSAGPHQPADRQGAHGAERHRWAAPIWAISSLYHVVRRVGQQHPPRRLRQRDAPGRPRPDLHRELHARRNPSTTASSAGGDKNILTAVNGQVRRPGGLRRHARERPLRLHLRPAPRHPRHRDLRSAVRPRTRSSLNHCGSPLDYAVGGWTAHRRSSASTAASRTSRTSPTPTSSAT